MCSWLPYDSIPLLSFAVILHVCSLLSYNSIVLLLFAGDLHVYRYESSSYCLICLQTAHMQFVAFCIHAYVYNMKLPIRSSSTCNSKIAPKLLLLKICWMLARKQDSFNHFCYATILAFISGMWHSTTTGGGST